MNAYRFIEAEKATWPVRLMCRVLDVSRRAYYDWRKREPSRRAAQDAVLAVHIKAIHRRSRGTYGSPRVHAELQAEGHTVSRKRVARLMAAHGLSGTTKRRVKGTTTQTDPDAGFADNLLDRDFTAEAPNQAWVGDITYLPTQAGWVYLVVLIDLYSRKVVGWALAPIYARSCASMPSTRPWSPADHRPACCTTPTAAPSTPATTTRRRSNLLG